MLNRLSRFHLVMDALNNARTTPRGAQQLHEWCEAKLAEHRSHVLEHMEDLPEIRDWQVEAPQRT